jgi:hypothetical protein
MTWQPVRARPIYRAMKEAVNDALNNYWAVMCKPNVLSSNHSFVCEELTLASFRLLRFIRKEIGGIRDDVDERKITSDVNDAVTDFYCLGEGSTTSFQEECDVLEILSRTAFREMKIANKVNLEEWR